MDCEAEQNDVVPFEHPAFFYRDTTQYLAGTIPFILHGLAAGEPVAVSVPEPNLELLQSALGADARHLRLLDMTQVGRNPGQILADVLHTAADPHPDQHVRIIGEPIWPSRTELEYPACLQHEALINLSFRGRRVSILCPYDTSELPQTVLDDAEQTHPVLIIDGERLPSEHYDPLQAIARTNRPLPPTPAQSISFDAARLTTVLRIARREAQRAALSSDRVDDFVLAIGELAANTIEHGGGRGTLRIWTEDGLLAGEIADSGHIRDLLAGRRHAPKTALSGRGLPIINHVADLVRTSTGLHGTTTRVYMRAPEATTGATGTVRRLQSRCTPGGVEYLACRAS